MRAAWVLAFSLAACGRAYFDPLSDGASGGSDSSDVGAPGCAGVFCDNFDRTTAPVTGWDTQMMAGNGSVKITPTGQLRIELGAAGDSGFLFKNLPSASSKIQISFRIQYTSAAPGIAEVDLVQLRLGMPSPECTNQGFFLVRDSTGPFDLQETYAAACGGNVNTPLRDLANNGFHQVSMTITIGPIGTAHVQVVIDADTPREVQAAHAIPMTTSSLAIGGAAVRDVTTQFAIEYDDLVISVQ